jgi:hypothetical protein
VRLLRRAGPSRVQALPRRHGLLVWLLRRLQHRELRPHVGVLRRHHQRPGQRRRCGRRRRRGSHARPRDRHAPGRGAKRSCWGRRRRTAGPSLRARGQAGGRVPNGAVAPRLNGRGGLCAWRTRTGAGPTGPRLPQHRHQRRKHGRAPTSEPEAHRRRDAATGYASTLDPRGSRYAPRGANSHRASGRPAGRKLGLTHPSTGGCAGR